MCCSSSRIIGFLIYSHFLSNSTQLHVTYHVTMEENALSQVFACVLPVGKETIVEQVYIYIAGNCNFFTELPFACALLTLHYVCLYSLQLFVNQVV